MTEILFLFSILANTIVGGTQSKIFINRFTSGISHFHRQSPDVAFYFIDMKKCSVEGCENKHYCKTYCVKHYQKFNKYGNPLYSKLHGMCGSLTHKSWESIKTRCLNKNTPYYKYYGGRGITVCERWKNSFLTFLEDMGPRPTKNHSIDRIDVNGNYEPSNCKWSTQSEQCFNRRLQSNNSSGYKGVKYDKRRGTWSAEIQFNKNRKYLGAFKTIEEAIEVRKKAELKILTKKNEK